MSNLVECGKDDEGNQLFIGTDKQWEKYVPPTDSEGDADYLKDVPKKLEKFNDKQNMEENDALERPEIYE